MAADDLRSRILDAATAVLRELGPTPRLLSAIAERAGVSRPTLYKYVGDKSGVFDALLQQEVEKLLDQVAADLGALTGGPDELVALIVRATVYVRDHPVVVELTSKHPQLVMRHLPRVVPMLVRTGTTHLAAAWERAAARGTLPPGLRLEPVLVWATRGILSLVLMPYGEQTPEELAASVRDLLELAGAVRGA